ncbi:MAG: polyprenyl synthetase family protein, partial [Candidatus Nezhaarchaeales archaeon]
IGAIIGGGNEGEVEALSRYGYALGLAYQARDDALDIDRKEEELVGLLASSIGGREALTLLRKIALSYSESAKKALVSLNDYKAKSYLIKMADLAVERSM